MSRFGNRPADAGPPQAPESRAPESRAAESRAAESGGDRIAAVFVYGTLRRGQCREALWPAAPLWVEPAWTRGTLFSRPDYPAMTAGADRVLGERWQFDPARMPGVIATLDEIEGANQAGQPDLYRRVLMEVFAPDGRSLGAALGYHYAADPTSDGFRRLQPATAEHFVQWPSDASP